jgi:hypothetical protein
VTGAVEPGETLILIARSRPEIATNWYLAYNNNVRGWMYENSAIRNGPCENLPVIHEARVPPLPETRSCYFAPYGDGSPFNVYNGPSPMDLETLDYVDSGVYPVLAESEYRIQVIGDQGITGWTIEYGNLMGHCNDLPFVQTRPALPGSGCYLYLFEPRQYAVSNRMLFDTSLWETITVPAQTYFEVTRYAGGALSSIYAFELQLPDRGPVWVYNENTGYGPFAEGVGNCENVPVTYPDDLVEESP